VTNFKEQSQHLPGGIEETLEILRVDSFRAENLIRDHPNTKECQPVHCKARPACAMKSTVKTENLCDVKINSNLELITHGVAMKFLE